MKQLSRKVNTEALCVLRARDAEISRTGRFQDFVAFGDWADGGSGPSIWFHGGTPFSSRLDNAPAVHFNIYGDCTLPLSMWMNVHNCPNVFDEVYIKQLTMFVQTQLPILFLVYNRNLDKEDALAYFQGIADWKTMLSSVYRIPDELYAGLLSCDNNAQLHLFCISAQIYGKQEMQNRPLLYDVLQRQKRPIFETEYIAEDCMLTGYTGNKEIVHIPEKVTYIAENVFAMHTEIKMVILPKGLVTIGMGAFRGCTGIRFLSIPKGVDYLCDGAFADCLGLEQIFLEEGITELDGSVFRDCRNLREIVISSSVCWIGELWEIFSPHLESIKIRKENPYYDSRNDCNAVIDTQSDCLLYGCKNTTIPDGVLEISNKAFFGCAHLKELYLPSSVKSIAEDAFQGCTSMTILCDHGSFAERYAQENQIPYRYVS